MELAVISKEDSLLKHQDEESVYSILRIYFTVEHATLKKALNKFTECRDIRSRTGTHCHAKSA